MSHVVTFSRRISEHELRDALKQGVRITVADEASWGLRLAAPDYPARISCSPTAA